MKFHHSRLPLEKTTIASLEKSFRRPCARDSLSFIHLRNVWSCTQKIEKKDTSSSQGTTKVWERIHASLHP